MLASTIRLKHLPWASYPSTPLWRWTYVYVLVLRRPTVKQPDQVLQKNMAEFESGTRKKIGIES